MLQFYHYCSSFTKFQYPHLTSISFLSVVLTDVKSSLKHESNLITFCKSIEVAILSTFSIQNHLKPTKIYFEFTRCLTDCNQLLEVKMIKFKSTFHANYEVLLKQFLDYVLKMKCNNQSQ